MNCKLSILAILLMTAVTLSAQEPVSPLDTIVGEERVVFDEETGKSVVLVTPPATSPRGTTVATTSDDLAPRKPFTISSDAYDPTNRDWWYLFKHGKLSLQDSTVRYPKFMKFCVDVYNWGDRTFNSYDNDYVEGTGYRWKAILKGDAWFDSYSMDFYRKMPMRLISEGWFNVGGSLHYMAVSAGYYLDMSNIIGNKPINHKKTEFSFTCARFYADFHYSENTGGSYLRTFGDYRKGNLFKQLFPGLKLYTWSINAYYFFNNRRYSQGAAYSFSKYQKRSQGSFILGFSYYNQELMLDFTKLPEPLLPYLKIPPEEYRVNYNSFNLLFGYGYNMVLTKNLIFNVTALPGIGLNHTFENSIEGKRDMVAWSVLAKAALTYNIGNVFLSAIGSMDGHWYKSSMNSLFSSVENATLSVGVRF